MRKRVSSSSRVTWSLGYALYSGLPVLMLTTRFQPQGVAKIHPLGELSPAEEQLVQAALPELKKNIEKGLKFAA